MKHTKRTVFFCAIIPFTLKPNTLNPKDHIKAKPNQFVIILESKWDDLEKKRKRKIFNDKWILAGDIIFKKKAPDIISLKELHLSWKGKKIENLIGSLYEKEMRGDLIPIEKYLICDSVWKPSEQKLILKFENPKTLYAVNKLSLVLTVPNEIEDTLKNGYFSIETYTLPIPYKEYVDENNINLVLGNIDIDNKVVKTSQ